MPSNLLGRIEFFLMDPRKGKPYYGAFSTITESLWIQFLRKLEDPKTNTRDLLRVYGVNIPSMAEATEQERERQEPETPTEETSS